MKITQKLIIAFSVLILIFIGEIILNQIITSHANDTYDKLMNKINPTIKTLAKYESINKRLNLLTNTRINGDEKIVTVNRFTRVLEIELRHIKKELYLLRDDALNITINKILVDKIINKTNQLINYSLKIDHLLKNKYYKSI